ncbi:MAG: decaprenyl-phosphate phosphoribosyltransferase [Candidatus Nanopelagicales bacterium]|nr:decaprenyl-phosphate phosphoribosyltransferase [Candidatus Nanopelagicales bacterium]MCF8539807.1 decaprenyl-phosphate phosphoribosyltransferase [Candidatus Nanopelagicales bacterium]MCF8551130.1 decaprenyl-phosphate phosphoribosyltransferase [Candidatus Nanopelagicales bacterium]
MSDAITRRSLPVAAFVALRPRQWAKNVLVFAAPLAAGKIFVPDVLWPSIGAFIAFCLISSATYLINDVRDVASDRDHPTKYRRPIAAGELPVPFATAMAAVLAAISIVGSYFIAPALAGVIVAYAVFTLAYSLALKHEPVIELALLSMGFLLRAVAGGAASDLPISQWFLIVAGFGSLFMAAGKRYSELKREEVNGGEKSATRRKALDGYTLGYLRFVWSVAAAVAIMGYALWAFDVAQTPSSLPWAEWSVLPFVLAILRYGVVIDKGDAEAPEDAVLGDRVLMLLGLAWLILFGLGALGV